MISLAALYLSAARPALPQDAGDVAAQIRELRTAVDAMREQLTTSRRESNELRREIEMLRRQLQAPAPTDAISEEGELLRAKVDDQEQTKIESGSKHHVRLSALVLLNVAGTRGSIDSLELPAVASPKPALDSGGALTADVRQSQIGLQVFGPTIGGARTTGDLAFDFFGTIPGTANGVGSPSLRLRTATFALDWKNTSLLAGQTVPFFSPRSPTSLVQTAYPALWSAGNLWAWTPQLRIEHRAALSGGSRVSMQWGILDPLTGELPAHEYNRVATAGERRGIPAQAAHLSWQRGDDARLLAVGAGGYHATQDWGFNRIVEAWAATTDWNVAIGPRIAVSGELYRGRAMAGLGGGASEGVLFNGPPETATSTVLPLDSIGGWAQLKIAPTNRLQFNAVFGEDSPVFSRARGLLASGAVQASAVNRNASTFVNTIFQARSNLLFSIEYRRLWTTSLDDARHTADYLSFATGVGF